MNNAPQREITHEILDASAFDELVSTNPEDALEKFSNADSSEQTLNRFVLAAFFCGRDKLLRQYLEHPWLSRGVRLAILAYFKCYSEVGSQEYLLTSSDSWDMEMACYGASAIAIAAFQEGNMVKGQSYLFLAQNLASALNMTSRSQMLRVEKGRMDTLLGNPDAEKLHQELKMPMPERRRKWTTRTRAEALMAEGKYEEALYYLGQPGEADDMRDFLHVLLGLPRLDKAGQEEPYARIADALEGKDKRNAALGDIRGEPQEGYAALVEAILLSKHHACPQQAIRLLSKRPFLIPDQALHRAIILMGAVAQGGKIYSPSTLLDGKLTFSERFGEAASKLLKPEELLGTTRRLTPTWFTLLAFGPMGDELGLTGISQIPLLCGKKILYQGKEIIVSGRSGTTEVVKGLGLPYDDLQREQKRRMRREIMHLPPLVNLGEVARGCKRLAAASEALGHKNEVASWKIAEKRVYAMMTPCAIKAISDVQ